MSGNMKDYVELAAGDPAPAFRASTLSQSPYNTDTMAGRYTVICFFLSAADMHSIKALEAVAQKQAIFAYGELAFLGVSINPADGTDVRFTQPLPGFQFIGDFEAELTPHYGVLPRNALQSRTAIAPRRRWVVIDPQLRVRKCFAFSDDLSEIPEIIRYLESLPPVSRNTGIDLLAPIVVLPNVFEPEFCNRLIDLYKSSGGVETGFMSEVGGRTVVVSDRSHKSRRDHVIDDDTLTAEIQQRFVRRVIPQIKKVYQFEVTRMERYIVSCYSAEEQAHFGAHRDNTTQGTAHRKFAVSVNLNDDFEGGEVRFPEYGSRTYKAPAGGAVIFSCSLLHAVSKVTRGSRYAFLPFLYDEQAAKIRLEKNEFLGDGMSKYQFTPPPERN